MCMEKYQILKDLALEFKSGRDPVIFKKIAERTEWFLIYTIGKAKRVKPYLRRVDIQDLYQIAIIGLHRALLKVKKDEPGSKLLYKIWRYVNNEIAICYKPTYRLAFPFSVSGVALQVYLYFADMSQSEMYISQIEDKLIEKTPVYKDLEQEFTRNRFSKLIEEEVISFEEFEMLTMRFVNDMTYKDIAKQHGIASITVSKKIEDVLNRLRFEFRRRNWEGI